MNVDEIADISEFLKSLTGLEIKCEHINKCILIKKYISKSRTDIVIDNFIPGYCSKENGGDCFISKNYNRN